MDPDRSFPEPCAAGLIVMPSFSQHRIDALAPIMDIDLYEEEMLCYLMVLERPGLKVAYVSSTTVPDAVVDYYLSHLSDPGEARSRLEVIGLDEQDRIPLAAKVLRRRDVLDGLRSFAGDSERTYLLPIECSQPEQRLADALGVPLYGPDPDLSSLGDKTASRLLAKRAGVRVLDGAEDLHSLEDVHAAILRLRSSRPDLERIVVKLNRGFGGKGNVIVPLESLRSRLEDSDAQFGAAGSWDDMRAEIARTGAIVEEHIGERFESPSVQLRVTPWDRLEVVSTHDQIVGGPDGQVYVGSRFPASVPYRTTIVEEALKVGRELASEGVVGFFGIDFIVTDGPGGVRVYMSEINLRITAAMRDFVTAQKATRGYYDPDGGMLVRDDHEYFYLARTNLVSKDCTGLGPAEAVGRLRRSGAAYRAGEHRGAILHLLGALRQHGRFGATCIGRSPQEAESVYDRVLRTFGVTEEVTGPSR